MLYEPTGQHRSLTMAHGDLNIPHLTAIADHKGMAVQPTAGTAIYSSQEQMSQNLPPPPKPGHCGRMFFRWHFQHLSLCVAPCVHLYKTSNLCVK